MATITFVSGSPEDIAGLEKTLETFEKVNSVGYISKEKLNPCSYIFRFPEGKQPDLEFNEILTKRFKELFLTIVSDNSAILFNEGNRHEYPKT